MSYMYNWCSNNVMFHFHNDVVPLHTNTIHIESRANIKVSSWNSCEHGGETSRKDTSIIYIWILLAFNQILSNHWLLSISKGHHRQWNWFETIECSTGHYIVFIVMVHCGFDSDWNLHSTTKWVSIGTKIWRKEKHYGLVRSNWITHNITWLTFTTFGVEFAIQNKTMPITGIYSKSFPIEARLY